MATSPYFTTSNQYILYDIHVDELSQSISDNTTTIKVWVIAWRTNQGYSTYGTGYCIVNIDGEEYYDEIDASQVISYESDTVLFERTVTIQNDPDGKKNIYVSAYFDHTRFTSNSQGFNVNLTQIPRQANILTAPNFYDVDNPTITYSNPAGAAVTSLQACISLNNSTATIAYRDISKSGSSYTFNLTQAERNTLLAATPNSNTLTVYFIVKTVIGGVTYYSSLSRKMTVKNANPTITGASYQDTNAATIAITGNNQKIIQNNSTVRFSFNTLTALKSATLVSIAVTVDGVTQSASLSGSTANNVNINFGAINSANNIRASIVLTDSRGNKTTSSMTVIILEWQLPTAIIYLARKNNFYDTTYINVNADYSALDGSNTLTIQYQYKETGAGSYGALATLQDDVTATITLDNTKSYDFKIIVSDSIGSTTYYRALQIGIPIFFIDKMRRSIGVGTMPKYNNHFCIDGGFILANLEQEELVNLETTVIDANTRGAYFNLKNNSGNTVAQLSGAGTLGGSLAIGTHNNKKSLELYSGTNGGIFGIYNHTSGVRVVYADSDSNGGRLWLLDNNNTSNIIMTGSSGNITCVSLTQTSSRKVKENIKPLSINEALKVLELIAVSFDFINKEQGKDKRGFIAEDVAEIIPELVTPETETAPASLDYLGLIPYLQTVIKDQEARINALESRIIELEKKLK